MLLDALLFVLSLIGFFISLYFALVYYQRIPANYFLVPHFCRMEESRCQSVLSVREARVFGVPNFLLGMIYYLIVFFLVFFRKDVEGTSALFILLGLSILVVVLSLYLAYSLVFRIKIPCPLCFISHGINIIIAVVFYLKTIE